MAAKPRLWPRGFVLGALVNFLIYIIYYMLMVIIASEAIHSLNASVSEAGLASGLFVLGTLVAYYVYLESTKYIPPAETGALAAFEPLSAYFFSVVVMGNRVGPVELVGALCIIVMVCVLTRND